MKTLEKLLAGIVLGGLICMLLFALSSCATNGYGCHGRSKIMTRVY
jgi:hypothetical protein